MRALDSEPGACVEPAKLQPRARSFSCALEGFSRVFADEELLRFIRTRVLDDIYARLTETPSPRSE